MYLNLARHLPRREDMTKMSGARFQAALSDRYVFDRVLGCGGMGTVYLARDVKHGRQVAIKALSPEVVEAIGARHFLKEIRVTAQLQHPHILPLLDSGEAAGCPYYVMPYVREGSLRDLLNEKTRLPIREALTIIGDIAGALEYAHGNDVVHCDIKPENILLTAGHAVLADFGIARAQRVQGRWGGRPWRAVVDSSGGTPAYVSPEQAAGESALDARSDEYSLACLLYEMLAGHAPFLGGSDQAVIAHKFTKPAPRLDQVVRAVPAGMSMAIEKAMALHPRHRFGSVTRFIHAIDAELAAGHTVGLRSDRRWSESLGILGYRLLARMRYGVGRSVADSKRGLGVAAAATTGRGLRQNTLG